MKKLIFSLPLLALCYLLSNKTVQAAIDINQTFPSPYKDRTAIGQVVSIFNSNAVILAGVMFLILMIIGGYTMLSAAGQEPQKFARGKDIIVTAFAGFLLILAAYWIIQIVQTMLGISGTPADIIGK